MNFNGSSKQSNDNVEEAQIIAAYQAILAVTDQMLQAAKNSDWDKLVALERNCKHLTNQLMEQHTRQPLSEAQQKKKKLILYSKYSPVMLRSARLLNPK